MADEVRIQLDCDTTKKLMCNVLAEDAPQHVLYPFVTGMYRSGGTHAECIVSMFQTLNTETFNVWSLVFASLTVACVVTPIAVTAPLWALPAYIAFISSPVIHLPFSCAYHAFMPMERDTAMKWRAFDIIAIFVASIPLAFALSYPVFPLWGAVAVTLAAVVVTCVFVPLILINQSRWGPTELSLCVACIALVYVFPMGWLFVQNCLRGKFPVTSFAFVGVVCSLLGGSLAIIYNWPQRWARGKFNVIGHSHNVMRVGIISALFCETVFFIFAMQQLR